MYFALEFARFEQMAAMNIKILHVQRYSTRCRHYHKFFYVQRIQRWQIHWRLFLGEDVHRSGNIVRQTFANVALRLARMNVIG